MFPGKWNVGVVSGAWRSGPVSDQNLKTFPGGGDWQRGGESSPAMGSQASPSAADAASAQAGASGSWSAYKAAVEEAELGRDSPEPQPSRAGPC